LAAVDRDNRSCPIGPQRYSQFNRKREERADYLAQECNSWFGGITIGDLIEAGFVRAEWRCRGAWCFHRTNPFPLTRYGRKAKPYNLRIVAGLLKARKRPARRARPPLYPHQRITESSSPASD
jgi:hypothetical protein